MGKIWFSYNTSESGDEQISMVMHEDVLLRLILMKDCYRSSA